MPWVISASLKTGHWDILSLHPSYPMFRTIPDSYIRVNDFRFAAFMKGMSWYFSPCFSRFLNVWKWAREKSGIRKSGAQVIHVFIWFYISFCCRAKGVVLNPCICMVLNSFLLSQGIKTRGSKASQTTQNRPRDCWSPREHWSGGRTKKQTNGLSPAGVGWL